MQVSELSCGTHPELEAVFTCSSCMKSLCEACATHDVDGGVVCERCGRAEEERSRSLGAALLLLVATGYLAILAIGVALFHARPFIGGVAAIVAIALGRALQLLIKPPVVVRRLRRS